MEVITAFVFGPDRRIRARADRPIGVAGATMVSTSNVITTEPLSQLGFRGRGKWILHFKVPVEINLLDD